jgi:hypothetical protein
MHADAVGEEALHVLAVGGVEAEVAEGAGDGVARVARDELRAGGPLGELAALALGEVDDVDRRQAALDEVFEGLV